jgi:putative ABC transport system substrate-binding protein
VGFLNDATIRPARISTPTAQVAQSLGVEILLFDVRGEDDFQRAIAAAAQARVGGLLVAGSPMFVRRRERLIELVTEYRLPAISVWRSFAESGLLMAYGPSIADEFRRAAAYVDKILRGARPADLPVEQPTKFELVINLKAAKALGITVPQSLLVRADEVIQ